MKTNILENEKISKLVWRLGLPMIVSMVLQALYNIVDTAFVINMGSDGQDANLALTYAFPIQILMIALSVGTGIGINALLSKFLGEKNTKKANQVVGNGIILGIIIFIIFLIFGFVGSAPFIAMQANGNEAALKMGTSYLTIVSTMSFGAIGFAIYERFLQSTGKTMLSTIAQIAGAVTNIILDYVFIYPCNMGVEGAAYATVIGQCVSWIFAMILHCFFNKQLGNNIQNLLPSWKIIKGIYTIGLPAIIMQALLSVMMFGMNMILGVCAYDQELIQGSFGIYYKIQQFALFAFFGLSNALITITSFNHGLKNKKRLDDTIKYGLFATLVVAIIIVILFESLASQISEMFGVASGVSSNDIVSVCTNAIRIATIGYIFMGINVSIQGILQGLRKTITPLIISFLRLVIFVFPIAYLFTLNVNVKDVLWWTFPIAELCTLFFSVWFLKSAYNKKVKILD